ncbi:MAG: Maf family protein [Candidatus Omnitrophota bacterium]
MKIILASGSKRRSLILNSCGIKHKAVVSGVKEYMNSKNPAHISMINARLKAEAVKEKVRTGYIIGADTVVLLGKKVIGKPRNAAKAKGMLKSMSGKIIYVYTGLCVINAKTGNMSMGYERSAVKVRKIGPADIEKYFKLLGPYDKAGGFSIEGAGSFIFDDIKGSYFNILGLPMAKLEDVFNDIGLNLLKLVRT